MTLPRHATPDGSPTLPVVEPHRIISLVEHRPTTYERVVKPVTDVVLAVLGLVVLAPVLLLVALAVLVTMGRPVLFLQTRIGHHGQPFQVLKFRTMQVDRRSSTGRWDGPERRTNHKADDDPRHTAVGTFLRRSSLDELPQLINVLLGQMSVVGPRPELPSVVARHYDDWHHRRHQVKPGLTGLWQVTARSDGPMHEHVEIDLDYVDSVSARTDLRIMAQTIPAALFTQRGR